MAGAAISPEATLRLWVAAGGRCQYRGCGVYLLEDALSAYELNLAERAHIVGATEAPGSPRGQAPLDASLRNEESNLLLLCRDHHKLIDTRIDEHSVEELRSMKREHEERILLLTGLGEEASTVPVRMIGAIRGAPVEIPRVAVQAAVVADRRFPRFRAALPGEDLEIDLRSLPDEEDCAYWAAGEGVIRERVARLREAQNAIGHVSVFALARLPFLVAIGFHLDDKLPVTVYPRRRDGTGDGKWGFDNEARRKSFQLRRLDSNAGERVALAVSLTAPLGAEVLAAVGSGVVYEIEPEDGAHSRELFSARGSLDSFAETYHRFLSTVEREHPDCTEIEVYLATPAPAAVQVGRGVMRGAQPRLAVFDRDSAGGFQRTLTLG